MNDRRRAIGLALAVCMAAQLQAAEGTAGGLRWKVPARWTEQPARSMRVATYTVPAVKGGKAAECGVFYFGQGRGGGVEENVGRWAQQFEGKPTPKTSLTKVRGIAVHRVDIAGTYLSPAGPTHLKNTRPPGASAMMPSRMNSTPESPIVAASSGSGVWINETS